MFDKLFGSRKTQTTTDTLNDVFDRAFQDQQFGTQNVPASKTKTSPQTVDLPKASAQTTKQKLSKVSIPAGSAKFFSQLSQLDAVDELTDEEAAALTDVVHEERITTTYGYCKPKRPCTDLAIIEKLPAILNKQIAAEGYISPEWHQVKNLPGYLQSPIRALGRQIFGTYTSTKLEDIQVLAYINKQGPNTDREINAVAGHVKNHGERYTTGEMEFQKSIEGYESEFTMFTYLGFTFMIVEDFAGQYIYVWPTDDEFIHQKTLPTKHNFRLT